MKILVVGADELVRLFVKTVMEKHGCQIIEAVDAIDGYKIIQETGDSIDLLLTDINMPRLYGLALAQLAAESFPDMRILLMAEQPSILPDGPNETFRSEEVVSASRSDPGRCGTLNRHNQAQVVETLKRRPNAKRPEFRRPSNRT